MLLYCFVCECVLLLSDLAEFNSHTIDIIIYQWAYNIISVGKKTRTKTFIFQSRK